MKNCFKNIYNPGLFFFAFIGDTFSKYLDCSQIETVTKLYFTF